MNGSILLSRILCLPSTGRWGNRCLARVWKGPRSCCRDTVPTDHESGVGCPCCSNGGIALEVLPPHHPVVGTIAVVILCAREISVPARLAIAHSFTKTFTLTWKYHSSESILKTHRQKFRKSVIYPGQSLHHYW